MITTVSAAVEDSAASRHKSSADASDTSQNSPESLTSELDGRL